MDPDVTRPRDEEGAVDVKNYGFYPCELRKYRGYAGRSTEQGSAMLSIYAGVRFHGDNGVTVRLGLHARNDRNYTFC